MKSNLPLFKKAVYVDIQKNWRKLKPLFWSEDSRRIWYPCMEEGADIRAEQNGYPKKERENPASPSHYDACDWRCDRRYPHPGFWDFACHSYCHWVADMCLYVAKTAYPKIPWRITTSSRHHTTVWNGDRKLPVLFDVNFSAIGLEASEALQLACKGRELKPGKYLKPYLHHAP